MTVDVNDTIDQYTASAGQTVFDFTFPITAESDLDVTQLVAATGVENTLVLNTDYSVTIDQDDEGSITLVTGAAAGDTITLERNTEVERTTDFQTSGDYRAVEINDQLDTLTRICQDLQRGVLRGVGLSPSTPTDVDGTLPVPEADKIIGWDDTAKSLENKDLADVSIITLPVSISEGGTGATTASNARASLGLTEEIVTSTVPELRDSILSIPDASSDEAEGVTDDRTAAVSFSFGEAGYVQTDGKIGKANLASNATMPATHLAAEAIASGESGTWLLYGKAEKSSGWSFSIGADNPIYVSSTAGGITQTPPSVTGQIAQRVAIPLASNAIFWMPDNTTIEVA